MSDEDTLKKQDESITVDGKPVTPDEFSRIQEEVNSDPNRKISEAAPGVYKILLRLVD